MTRTGIELVLHLDRLIGAFQARINNLDRYDRNGETEESWLDTVDDDYGYFNAYDTDLEVFSNYELASLSDHNPEASIEQLINDVNEDLMGCINLMAGELAKELSLTGQLRYHKLQFEYRLSSSSNNISGILYQQIIDLVPLPLEHDDGVIGWRATDASLPPAADLEHDIALCDTMIALLTLST